jgi:hypothetical protein
MTARSRFGLVALCLAMCGGIPDGRAQTAPGQAETPKATAEAPPAPREPLLGRGHLWLKLGRTDLDTAAADEWGVDRVNYLGLEGYYGSHNNLYFGGELGTSRAGTGMTASGNELRDVDFWWMEMNEKFAFDLKHGLTIDAGLGWSLFYVNGDEVLTQSGQEFTDPLADIGLGAQIFVDFNWRARHLLLGLDAKYQWAFDVIDIDYSNVRLGAHVGVAF